MSDIVIYGRGKTGQSLYKMLQRQGKQAVFYDDTTLFDEGGGFEQDTLVLLSPGVKPNALGIKTAKRVGAKIMSELEYCFKYCRARCVSVTGTNGKTTTCEMINYLLKKSAVACRLLGNGGVPLSSEVLDISADEIVVLESSSFQLDNAETFAPYVSVFTSLACDHLDYHGGFDDYVRAKANNFFNQRSGYALFNADDVNVAELSCLCKCKRLYYSAYDQNAQCYYDGKNITVNVDGLSVSEPCGYLRGLAKHNLSNALAAILVSYLLGIPLKESARNICGYEFLPHRMQTVGAIGSVTFVDDSKATNVHATVHALANFKQPLALILGGSDKGESFDAVFKNLPVNTVAVTASGSTAARIADCGKLYGVSVEVFEDIKQATEYCYNAVKQTGGVVLMSNACASFDKFNGYAERGEYFQQVVKGLNGGKTTN